MTEFEVNYSAAMRQMVVDICAIDLTMTQARLVTEAIEKFLASFATMLEKLEDDENGAEIVIQYDDMTDAQKRIVDAGMQEPAGTFPSGLSKGELTAWIRERRENGLAPSRDSK